MTIKQTSFGPFTHAKLGIINDIEIGYSKVFSYEYAFIALNRTVKSDGITLKSLRL